MCPPDGSREWQPSAGVVFKALHRRAWVGLALLGSPERRSGPGIGWCWVQMVTRRQTPQQHKGCDNRWGPEPPKGCSASSPPLRPSQSHSEEQPVAFQGQSHSSACGAHYAAPVLCPSPASPLPPLMCGPSLMPRVSCFTPPSTVELLLCTQALRWAAGIK